jgi:hypothetical protein
LRIDETHRKWFIGSLITLAVALVVYIPYSRSSPQGATGGSVMGLVYGSVGSAFMLFAGLLGLRKKFPIWRIGRAQAWMRGHLWLGFLAFPIILFHAGLHFGGALTTTLMWLFIVVFVSGILGAVLQHYMPRLTLERIPMETIYEQIERVRGQLLEEAAKLVEEAVDALAGNLQKATAEERACAASAGTMGGLTVASGLQVDEEAAVELRGFFTREIQPFLKHAGSRGPALGDAGRSEALFRQLRVLLPSNVHSTVDDLENVCEEKRQLDQQSRYHKILHGWLLVHIPISYALLLLGAVHAVIALRY